MIKCNLCNNKFYDVVLDNNDEGEEILICGKCFQGKIKHRVYTDPQVEITKEPKEIKLNNNICSSCFSQKKTYVRFGDFQFCFECSLELYF